MVGMCYKSKPDNTADKWEESQEMTFLSQNSHNFGSCFHIA